jgi:hypothetical protein
MTCAPNRALLLQFLLPSSGRTLLQHYLRDRFIVPLPGVIILALCCCSSSFALL